MHDINLKQRTLDWMARRQFRSKGRGTLWASEASVQFINEFNEQEVVGKCKRAVWYRLKGVEETNPPNAKSQMIFTLGHIIEAQFTELWKQMGIWENNSVRWEDRDRNLSGEFDIILREGNDRFYGVEMKSFYGYHANKQILGHWSGRGANKVFINGRPKDEHLMQASIYADQARDRVEGFKLFYASRDNNDLAEFNITVPDAREKIIYINGIAETRFTLNEVYNRYDLLNELKLSNRPPERDYTYEPDDHTVKKLFERGEVSTSAYKKHTDGSVRYTDWHCSYCNFKDYCLGALGDSPVGESQDPRPDHMQHGGL
jgi:CRISPR/Cas system-associated exonuclease Cas4 (RecB family)